MEWVLVFVFVSTVSDTVAVQTERFTSKEDCDRVGNVLMQKTNQEGSRQSYHCEQVIALP